MNNIPGAKYAKKMSTRVVKKVQNLSSAISIPKLLSNPRMKKYTETEILDAKEWASKHLQPGDLVLMKTLSPFHNKGRQLTNSIFDHTCLVLEDGETVLHIAYPEVRLAAAWTFCIETREPHVI